MMAEIPNGSTASSSSSAQSPFLPRNSSSSNNNSSSSCGCNPVPSPFANKIMLQKPTSKDCPTTTTTATTTNSKKHTKTKSAAEGEEEELGDHDVLYIKRTRSLDDTRLGFASNSTRNSTSSHEPLEEPLADSIRVYHNDTGFDEEGHDDEGGIAATSLNSSFDASLLREESASVFQDKNQEGFVAGGYDDRSESIQTPSGADLSGKKHYLRTGIFTESNSTQEANPIDTVRKKQARVRQARSYKQGIVTDSKTPARPSRTRQHDPTGKSSFLVIHSPSGGSGPSSAAKRRREPPLMHPARQSPMRRVPPHADHNFSFASADTTTPAAGNIRTPPPPMLPSSLVVNPFVAYTGNRALKSTVLFGKSNVSNDNDNTQKQPPLTPNNRFVDRSTGPFGTVKKMPYSTDSTAPLETTFETDTGTNSVETSSPARFRFTSFPASLPRVNNPRATPRECPGSVRKHMSFGESEGFGKDPKLSPTAAGTSASLSHNNDNNASNPDLNQSRDDEGTQNTSISTLSDHQHLPHLPHQHPAHFATPHDKLLFPEEAHSLNAEDKDLFLAYSDDDGDDGGDHFFDEDLGNSPVRRGVDAGRTRLDFNGLLSPDDKCPPPEGPKATAVQQINFELSQPYDPKHVNSFPSSLSSNTQMNVSGCDDEGATSTPPRGSRDGRDHRPHTPREVELHFPLESECSPIPNVKDDVVEGGAIERRDNSLATSSALAGDRFLSKTTTATSPSHGKRSERKEARKEEGSFSSNSTNTQKRLLRPMPDMSAFDNNVTSSSRVDRSADDSTAAASTYTQRRLCPPTPQRTPAWANEGGGHALFSTRQNSLITTKVLLSCPSQVLEGRSSLESSVLLDDDATKASDKKRNSLPPGLGAGRSAKLSSLPLNEDTESMEIENTESSPTLRSLKGIDPDAETPRMQIPGPPRLTRRFSSNETEPSNAISFTNDFEVLGLLGSGAFADVYKVRSIPDNNLFAVKRNRRQFRGKKDRDMALAEVQSMQQLQSVFAEAAALRNLEETEKYCYSLYLLFFYRAWQEDGYFYCQTELCCRDTCREMLDSLRFAWNVSKTKYPSLLRNLPAPFGLKAGGPEDNWGRLIPENTVWKICHDIAAGLSHIHSHGIVHQDIKPGNILFVPHARFGAMCKIGDFGMAGSIGSSGDGQEGDTKYMPPELLSSATRHASSDIFSLGLTLYEIASDEQIEMPSEGPGWHELRSANAPKLPAGRCFGLEKLLQAMTNPEDTKRPSADVILSNEKVKLAGHDIDTFLRDYIKDVEEFERREEERLASDQAEDQTPRHDHKSAAVRSPSLSMLFPNPPSLTSPLAHQMH